MKISARFLVPLFLLIALGSAWGESTNSCGDRFNSAGRELTQQQFDVYTFSVPKEYKSQAVSGSLVLSSPDDRLSILLVVAKRITHDAYEEFDIDWDTYVTSKYQALGLPNIKAADFSSGWTMTTGQSYVLNGEQRMWIQICNFTKADRKAGIVCFAVDDKQEPAIRRFIGTLSLSDTPSVKVAPKAPLQPARTAMADPKSEGAEVWMWINIKIDSYSSYYDTIRTPKAYMVLFEDGNFTSDKMPAEGLLNFSINSPKASEYTWGRYTRSGSGLKIKSAYEDTTLVIESKDTMVRPGWTNKMHRCKPADGLRLQGSWSYIINSEQDPYYDEPGCRQVIYFRNDGTFDDRGVFVSDCRYPHSNPENAPGTGTYSIKNFTLILNYSDGRVRYSSFTGSLSNDPFIKNDIIFIGGTEFFKRKK